MPDRDERDVPLLLCAISLLRDELCPRLEFGALRDQRDGGRRRPPVRMP